MCELLQTCSQLNDQRGIVRLYLSLVRCLVSDDRAAFITFMDYNVSLFRIRLCLDRTEYASTVVGSVTGIYIHVQGAETEGAVITRGITEWQNLFTAVFTYESIVVFSKSFVFHIITFQHRILRRCRSQPLRIQLCRLSLQ